MDRVIALENKFCNMQSVVDRCLCENLELKDHFCEKNYLLTVITSQLNSTVKPSTVNSMDKSKQNHPTISSLVNRVGNRQNKGETNYVPSHPGLKTDYFKHDANHNLAWTQSLLSMDHKSVVSVDSEGFRKPTYAMKKPRRNAKSVNVSPRESLKVSPHHRRIYLSFMLPKTLKLVILSSILVTKESIALIYNECLIRIPSQSHSN